MEVAEDIEISDIRSKLGHALANSGRGREAANVFLEAAKLGGERAPELYSLAASQLLRSGHIDSGLETLDSSLRYFGETIPKSPQKALLSLIGNRARLALRGLRYKPRLPNEVPQKQLLKSDLMAEVSLGLGLIDTIRGADFQAKCLIAALDTGESKRIAKAVALELGYLSTPGSKTNNFGKKAFKRAHSYIQKFEEPGIVGISGLMLGISNICHGRWKIAERIFFDSEKILKEQCSGVHWEISSARSFSFWAQWYQGKITSIAHRTEQTLAEAYERGDLYSVANIESYFIPMVILSTDQTDAAIQASEKAIANWSQRGFHFQHYCHFFATTQVLIYKSCSVEAANKIEKSWPALRKSLILQVQQNRIEAVHFRARAELAAYHAGNRDKNWLKKVRKAAKKIRKEKSGWGDGLSSLLMAGIHHNTGNSQQALECLRQAIQELEFHDMALYAASAKFFAAQLATGQDANALEHEANDYFEKQGVVNPPRMAAMMVPGFD